jgi:hypothetical protein
MTGCDVTMLFTGRIDMTVCPFHWSKMICNKDGRASGAGKKAQA